MRHALLVVTLLLAAARSMGASVSSADGVPIAYEVYGEGSPALVFIHGWSCDRSYWTAQLEPFSRRHQVVAIDLGGHGESGQSGRSQWTIASFGADVASVVQHLGLERVILIGHSMGGDVTVEAARLLPGRVAGLVWVDTYHELGPSTTPEQIETFTAPFRRNFVDSTRTFVRRMFPENADPALVEQVALDMSAAPPAIALSAMRSAVEYENKIPAMMQRLKLPVVALNAGYRPTNTVSLKRHGVETVVMPDVGHFLMMEKPEPFNAMLASALERITR